jgi:hypothetical protein
MSYDSYTSMKYAGTMVQNIYITKFVISSMIQLITYDQKEILCFSFFIISGYIHVHVVRLEMKEKNIESVE